MKKMGALIVMTTLLLSLTGCFGGIKLEEEQMHLIFDKDDGLTMLALIEDKDLEDEMDIDFDDKEKDIAEDIQDYLDDEDQDGELISFKKQDDYGLIEIFYKDAEDLYYELDYTLEEYAEDIYGDIDDLADEEDFVFFSNGKDVDDKDLEDYEDYLISYVYGGDNGSYYTFAGKIELVDDDVKFEKIDNYTIFVEDDEYGIVAFEEY